MNADFAYNKNGNYIHILQQVTVIETTADKHPLLFLSYIYDITHLKKPESANLVITAPHETLIWNYDFDNQQLKPAKPLNTGVIYWRKPIVLIVPVWLRIAGWLD